MKKQIIIASTRSLTQNLFLNKLIKFLQIKGYETILLCRDPKNLKIKNSRKIQILFPKKIYEFLNIKLIISEIIKIIKINKKFNRPLILLNTPMASHFIRMSLFFHKTNIIYFVHGYRFHSKNNIFKNILFKSLEYLFSFKTKKYININKEDYSFTKKSFNKKNILIRGVGINLQKKKIVNNKKKNKKIIGVLAAYKKEKGYLDIINLAENIQHLEDQIEIKAFGYGDRKTFSSIISKKRLRNIKLSKFKINIIDEIKKFDFLLHASFREGLPVSVIQALSCGKPVIGRKIRGNIDLIKNASNGYLFENIEEVYPIIKKVISDQNLYKKLSKNASCSINKYFQHSFINHKIYKFIKNDE